MLAAREARRRKRDSLARLEAEAEPLDAAGG